GVQHHSPAVFEPHVPLGLFEKFNATREFGSVLMEQEALERLDLPVREIVLMENRAPDGVREQPFRPLRRVELRGGRA
ncbi:MAG: hypothetical protein FJ098_16990, partial [Deltaproteobacteria bacterium]|nr:hypothetical protein [Deltaproteobacteria bacterium]